MNASRFALCRAHQPQAIYSTGCSPTISELTRAVSQTLNEPACAERGGITKKAFKALMLQMQRTMPREQDVLKDLEILRGAYVLSLIHI